MEAERRTRMGAKRSQQGGLFLVQPSSSGEQMSPWNPLWCRQRRANLSWEVPGPFMGPGPVWVTLIICLLSEDPFIWKVKTASGFHWWLSSCGITVGTELRFLRTGICNGSETRVLLGEDLDKEQGSSQKLTFPHNHYERKKHKKTKQKITGVGEDAKGGTLCTEGENVKRSSPMENSTVLPSENLKIELRYDHNSPSGYTQNS